MQILSLFDYVFWLFTLHFIADFRLQSDFIAKNKSPGSTPIWPFVLSGHAATHAAVVGFILSPIFGFAEFVAHAATDCSKDCGFLGRDSHRAFYIDQALHLVTKLVWLILFLNAPASWR